MLSEKADGKMAKAGLLPKSKHRVAAHRARKREAGLVRLELWLTPAERDQVKAYAKKISGKTD